MSNSTHAPDPLATFSTATILIVDDHPENLQLLAYCLKDTGYTILLAEDGEQCLDLAHSEKPDVILLDIIMPGMDGFEVCSHLKNNAQTWHIAIIFLSALSNIENKIKGFRLGAADYINKPFQLEEVLARVNTQVHLRILRKQLEHQNQLLQEQAKQLQQSAQQARTESRAKSHFMAISSHDLRQPLHALSLLLETLNSKVEHRPLLVLTQRIRQSINALSHLFNTLLDVSQLDAQKIKPHIEILDLNTLAYQLQEEFATQAQEKGLTLTFAYCPKPVCSDPSLLKRILQNLLSNAIRYTQQGSVSVSYTEQDEYLNIIIQDTGIGIAEAQQQRIFEEFYRIDNSTMATSGLGLGLNIVKRLAALLQHPLHIQSRLNNGSSFILSVPYVPATDSEIALSTAISEAHSLSIALLEKDPDTLAITLELLEDWGHHVIAVAHPDSLLKTLSQQDIDLLISDFQDSDTLKLIQQLRTALGYAVPVLFVTSETALQRSTEITISGTKVLAKPVNPDHLYDALQSYPKLKSSRL